MYGVVCYLKTANKSSAFENLWFGSKFQCLWHIASKIVAEKWSDLKKVECTGRTCLSAVRDLQTTLLSMGDGATERGGT